MAITAGHRPSLDYESAGASLTLTAADSGKVYVTSAADIVFTLPDATGAGMKGVYFTFINNSLSGGTGMLIRPAATDKIQGKGITAADDKDYINSGATDAIGDLVTVVCDGVDGYWVVSERGTWAREA
jgi:hypothetical protein